MSAEQSEPPSTRGYALLAIKLTVSVALLSLLFSRIDVGHLWVTARSASMSWLAAALLLYSAILIVSIWRWHLLLDTQGVHVARRTLLGSYLVALFFNNFLPSNIGGDVIRIRDTARPAQSKTLARSRGAGQPFAASIPCRRQPSWVVSLTADLC